jgi:hypothetical protein
LTVTTLDFLKTSSSAAFWGRKDMVGQWVAQRGVSWELHLLVAKRTRPTVVAVTVSGSDLILVIRGLG